MNPTEQQAILTIVLLAAFADSNNSDSEREAVRRVAESLGGDDVNAAQLYQDVLLKRATVASAAAQLKTPELRQLAYELAVGVCDADKLRNDAETLFLAELGNTLGLTQPQIAGTAASVDALVTVPLQSGAQDEPAALPGPVVASQPSASDAELDQMILNYSILNGALELLPQSMASMAIIPLQMKMVYRVGKAHGFELDRGHIKDLLAAMGVGLTGQYLEDIGRKLIGGLFGQIAGGIIGGLARGTTGIAFSFATTYALGQVAKRYYAGGRTMTTQMLKDTFNDMLGEARGLRAKYMPQIEQQARTVDINQIVQMVRSQ